MRSYTCKTSSIRARSGFEAAQWLKRAKIVQMRGRVTTLASQILPNENQRYESRAATMPLAALAIGGAQGQEGLRVSNVEYRARIGEFQMVLGRALGRKASETLQ
jgi:hypothetical protein